MEGDEGPALMKSYGTSCLHAWEECCERHHKKNPLRGLPGSRGFIPPVCLFAPDSFMFTSSQKLGAFLKEVIGQAGLSRLCAYLLASQETGSGFLVFCVPLPMWVLEMRYHQYSGVSSQPPSKNAS